MNNGQFEQSVQYSNYSRCEVPVNTGYKFCMSYENQL